MNIKASTISIINILIFVLLVISDQVSKYFVRVFLLPRGSISLIENVLELRYLENYGAAFGILKNQKTFFVVVTIIILLIIMYVIRRIYAEVYNKNIDEKLFKKFRLLDITLIVLSAGAVGNLIDRIRFNYVVDFIYFRLIDFPIFNIADCCVTLSAIMLILLFVFILKDNDFQILFPSKSKDLE